MPKRSSKKLDLSQLAKLVVDSSTGSAEKPKKPAQKQKNEAAVALGRLGGRKGGKARAAKLTAQQRREIARKAAQARWRSEEKR